MIELRPAGTVVISNSDEIQPGACRCVHHLDRPRISVGEYGVAVQIAPEPAGFGGWRKIAGGPCRIFVGSGMSFSSPGFSQIWTR